MIIYIRPSHDYTNIQLRYSSAIAPYTSLYPLHNLTSDILDVQNELLHLLKYLSD
jgi:hypothetical protein